MDIKQELLKLLERRVFNAEELVEEIDKLYKQDQALQLQQTGVIVRSEQLKCDVCEESEWESHSEGFICGNCKNVVEAF